MSGFTRCGWISTSSSDLFLFYRAPFPFLCGSRAGCPQGCSSTVGSLLPDPLGWHPIPCAGSVCECSSGSNGQGMKQHPGSCLSGCRGLGVPLPQADFVLLSTQVSLH